MKSQMKQAILEQLKQGKLTLTKLVSRLKKQKRWPQNNELRYRILLSCLSELIKENKINVNTKGFKHIISLKTHASLETYAKSLPPRRFKSTRDMRKAMNGVGEHIDVKEAQSHEDFAKAAGEAKWDMLDPKNGKEIFDRYKQHGRIGVVNVKTGGIKKKHRKWLYYTPNKDAPQGFDKKMLLNEANEPRTKVFRGIMKWWVMPSLATIFTTAGAAAPSVMKLLSASGGIPTGDIAAGLNKLAAFGMASSGPVMGGLLAAGAAGIAAGFLVNAVWHGLDRKYRKQARKFITENEDLVKGKPGKGRAKRTKLSPKQVMKIRKQHKSGTKNSKLAKQYKVSPSTIHDAIKGVGAYRNLSWMERAMITANF